jgi:hypothetical protein
LLSGGEEGALAIEAQDCVDYDTHVRNEEIYQDLCSIDNTSLPQPRPIVSFGSFLFF